MKRRIIFIAAVLFWMGLIFYMSAQPAKESSEMSIQMGRILCRIFVPQYQEMSEAAQLEYAGRIDHFVRKTAHFTEYAVLGMLLYGLVFIKDGKRWKQMLAAASAGAVYAASDEFHQLFVPGRACSVLDVLLDSAGVITGTALAACAAGAILRGKKGQGRMNSNWFKLFMKCNHVKYGKDLLLKGVPFIYNKKGASLVIGSHCTIKSSFLSNLVGLYSRTIIVTRTPEAKIWIGDHVGISGATIYARKGITIGDNTCIGGNVKILDNDFHPVEAEKRNELLSGDAPESGERAEWIGTRPVQIGKNCFIGCNAIILKGTVLGDGCVVGAGAVVSGKFEDNCVIAGNPARVIRRLDP